jgi:hypothetical protein
MIESAIDNTPSLLSSVNYLAEELIMKRFIVATLVGLTIAASLSTSASAFRCLAQSSNGVNTGAMASLLQGPRDLPCAIAGSIVVSSTVARLSAPYPPVYTEVQVACSFGQWSATGGPS